MITVLGSINIDLVARTRRLPRPGETVAGHTAKTEAGGKGANQALAVHRAGGPVQLIGAVGTDDFATPALAVMKAAGLDLSGIRKAEGATGSAFILIGDDGENMITVVAGANGLIGEDDVGRAVARTEPGGILMLQMEIPAEAVAQALTMARGRGQRTILNIAPATDDIVQVAPLADIVIANESEFELLAGEPLGDLDAQVAALHRLHERGGQTIIVTLGPAGAMAISDSAVINVAALNVTPIDTVGAGDTFCGYFAAELHQHGNVEMALRVAAAAGSLACTQSGAQTAIPEREFVLRHFH
ncbi:ribokinase [Rhizobium sp. BR 315]|uniref:ribokinase n=1 Tax=Rhizobium sp. BR 315 TaxID=3040014 RepID=UPI003D351429